MTRDEARQKLKELRVVIDDLDRRIVGLLNDRVSIVEDIGRVKRDADMPVVEPDREARVFENVRSVTSDDPLAQEAMQRIFERIIEEMRQIQKLRMESNGEPPVSQS